MQQKPGHRGPVEGHSSRHRRVHAHRCRPRRRARHHAPVDQPGAAGCRLRLHLVLPVHPPLRVLLVLLGTGIGYLYNQFDIGVPFGQQIGRPGIGLWSDLTFFTLDYNSISSTVWIGILALGTVRGGIHGRDRPRRHPVGRQGPGRGRPGPRHEQRHRRCGGSCCPQAMRVIVPPTGNETIAMVKDTSLFIAAVPVITELFYQTTSSAQRSFQIMPGSSRRPSGTSSSARCSWSVSPTWRSTSAVASEPSPRRPSRSS
jgi:hypothetical protein